MEGALAWVSQIAAWIGQFIPQWEIVDTAHGAVKFVRGHKVISLGPGWHLYWPLTTRMTVYPMARQANDLRAQTLVTTDDKTIVVGGLIVFEIDDIEAIVAHTFDPDQTINDISLAVINGVLSDKAWHDLKMAHQDGSLDRELLKQARRELEKYGVKVLRMTLTDLAPCRVFKLMGDRAGEQVIRV